MSGRDLKQGLIAGSLSEAITLGRTVREAREQGRDPIEALITATDTDWDRIVALYDLLLRVEPSPVFALNRAVAVAMADGPAAGLPLVDALLARGELASYHFAHAARADLCRRLGRVEDARASYVRALTLTQQAPERRFLERRLQAL